jgi:hypothetical protein
MAYRLKQMASTKFGIAMRDVHLVYGTKDLEDNCRLGCLPNQVTIQLCTRLLGGNEKVKVST